MHYLNAIIDRLEGNFAVLRTQDQQELLWPKDNLPPYLTAGSAVKLIIKNDEALAEEQQKTAQALLQEIFKE